MIHNFFRPSTLKFRRFTFESPHRCCFSGKSIVLAALLRYILASQSTPIFIILFNQGCFSFTLGLYYANSLKALLCVSFSLFTLSNAVDKIKCNLRWEQQAGKTCVKWPILALALRYSEHMGLLAYYIVGFYQQPQTQWPSD